MDAQARDPEVLRLLAGNLCLDFVNSVEDRDSDAPEEFLISYEALVRWGRHAGALTDAEAERLLAQAARDESAANATLAQALRLREALHRVFLAIARQAEPPASDLATVQQAYREAVEHAQLRRANGTFRWHCPQDDPHLDRVLWPIAFAALDLLTEGDPRRIKVCANPHGCGWLFYDGSKNGSRRWCRMEGCGSQVKMRRQYAKRRAALRA